MRGGLHTRYAQHWKLLIRYGLYNFSIWGVKCKGSYILFTNSEAVCLLLNKTARIRMWMKRILKRSTLWCLKTRFCHYCRICHPVSYRSFGWQGCCKPQPARFSKGRVLMNKVPRNLPYHLWQSGYCYFGCRVIFKNFIQVLVFEGRMEYLEDNILTYKCGVLKSVSQ